MESLEHFATHLLEMGAEAKVRADAGLTELALRLEREMKLRAGEGGAHRYGYRGPDGEYTTATKGRGPAVISGDLRRSITHQKVPEGYRVGPASIIHTSYGSRGGFGWGSGATCGEIGSYLEKNYPFIGPARDAVEHEAEDVFRTAFEGPM